MRSGTAGACCPRTDNAGAFSVCLSDATACSTGSQCCSGLCISGACRAAGSCSSYPGYGCSTDGNTWNLDAAGTCLSAGTCDYSDPVRMDCAGSGTASCQVGTDATYDTCTINSGDSCDSSAGGNFAQIGICASGATNNCATSGFVSSCSGNYYNTAACAEGSACDETLTDGDFSAGSKRYDPDDNLCDNCASVIGEDGNCEQACGSIAQCDEYATGTDLVSCNVGGQTYFGDECSGSCTGQDRDTVCRSSAYHASCTAYSLCNNLAANGGLTSCALGPTYFADDCGANCAGEDRADNVCRSSAFAADCTGIALCNGLATNSNIATCSAGQTYFADDCAANCGGEDRGDNICRSSAFAGTCTGNINCNGLGTDTCPSDANICTSSCTFVDRDTSQAYCIDATGCNAQEWNAGASQCCGDDGAATEDWDRDNYASASQCCLNGGLLNNGATSANYICNGANPQLYRCGGSDSTGTIDTESAHCDLVGGRYCDMNTGTWTAAKPNGCPEDIGTDCTSGLVVNGLCVASCDGYSGLGCSTDANPYHSPLAGTCYDDLGATFGCDYTAEERMNCGGACVLGVSASYAACNAASGDACDSDVGGNFSQDGLCTAGGCDTTSHSCFDDVNYQIDCSSCSLDYDLDPQGDACDSSLANGDYSAIGLCVTGAPSSCVAVGTTVRANVNNGNIFTSGCDMSGSRCDTSVSTTFSADGVCASSACDAVDVVLFAGAYYGNCDGRGGIQCDTDTSNGAYVQNGMCFDDSGAADGINFDCENSGFIYYNGTHFRDDSQVTARDLDHDIDSDGRSCDRSITSGGDYSADGMVTTTGCAASGSVVRIDASSGNNFTLGCDDSHDRCDSSVASSLNSPFAIDCACANSVPDTRYTSITINNIGETGFDATNPEFTPVAAVVLNLDYLTAASRCRFINHESGTSRPADNDPDWSAFEPCSNVKLWQVTEGNGPKYVYFQVDYTGLGLSVPSNDTIALNYTGAGLDVTPPSSVRISYSGYTNDNATVKATWTRAADRESEILKIPLRYNYTIIANRQVRASGLKSDPDTSLVHPGFNFAHGDKISINVTVINSAGLKNSSLSENVTIDLRSPNAPVIGQKAFLNKTTGLWQALPDENTWIYADEVKFSWSATDDLSGIGAFSYVLSDTSLPDKVPEGKVGSFSSETSKVFTSVRSAEQHFRVQARDGAGNWGTYASWRARIDNTPPTRPVIVDSVFNPSTKKMIYYWTEADDISGIRRYRLNITRDSGEHVASIDYDSSDTQGEFTALSSDGYVAIVGAQNGVGLWRWSNQDDASLDIEPPEILGYSTGKIVGAEPIIFVMTDEVAVCTYRDGSSEPSQFLYTNTTYHESKVRMDDGLHTVTVECSDAAGNSRNVASPIQIVDATDVSTVVIPPSLSGFKDGLLSFRVNVSDGSGSGLGGLRKEDFTVAIAGKKVDFVTSQVSGGTYGFSLRPTANGTFGIAVTAHGVQSDTESITVDNIKFDVQYHDSRAGSLVSSGKMVFGDLEGYDAGIGASSSEAEIISSASQMGTQLGYNEYAHIFITESLTNPNRIDKLLESGQFMEKLNPSFGYDITDDFKSSMVLSYDEVDIITDIEGPIRGDRRVIVRKVRSPTGKKTVYITYS